MKTNKLKSLLFAGLTASMLVGCVDDNDTSLPDYTPVVFGEDFETNAVDNTPLNLPGWTNFAESGTKVWNSQYYSSNNYAEFTSFQSGEAVNVAWLVSPSINMDTQEGEKLVFQVAQSYVTSANNSFEALISTDFDGTNVTTATWEHLEAFVPGPSAVYFKFYSSGEIDLSAYTGNIHLAFKVKGSGTNTSLDGSYQIDNVRIIN